MSVPMVAVEDGPPSLPEIVTRYLSGESIQDIAKDCNRSRRTLYRWMLTDLGGEKYRELVTECLVARVSDADQELQDARLSGDPVRVSAARETCRFARMDLERRRPALYGPKQEVKHTGSKTFRIEIVAGSEVGALIENPPQDALEAPPL